MENVILEVVKEKTNIKGFWKASNGQLFLDNIKAFKAENAFQYESKLQEIFGKGELAVFTIGRQKAFILFANGDLLHLNEKLEYHETSLKASKIKDLINTFGGLTIERESKGFYIITIWKE